MIKEECNYNYRCKDDRCLFACLISRGKGGCKHNYLTTVKTPFFVRLFDF